MRHSKIFVTFLLSVLFLVPKAQAQEAFINDLALEDGSISSLTSVIVGKDIRIYATVSNHSDRDLLGTVKFYDEVRQVFIGEDQPISVIAGRTDDVFVDWKADKVGNYPISARIIPWEEAGDNPDNNKTTTTVKVDYDSDNDGVANYQDADDDNDGVNDNTDAFPLDPRETQDIDKDGTGNNADTDDDGDGVVDVEDVFPNDPNESVDTDGDGVGDNADIFPTDEGESMDTDEDGLGDNADPDNANKGPVVQIDTEELVVSTGKKITFNALKAHDLDGEIVDYEWDFGQGVESTSVVVDKVFEEPGTYNVRLKVRDDKGEERVSEVTVTVIQKWQTWMLWLILLLLLLLIIYTIHKVRGESKKALRSNEGTGSEVKKKKTLPKKKK